MSGEIDKDEKYRMRKQEHLNFWKTSLAEDWLTANEIAAKNERKYFSHYIAHLRVEKILKALYVKIFDRTPPYKHDLYLLAEKCGINLVVSFGRHFRTETT